MLSIGDHIRTRIGTICFRGKVDSKYQIAIAIELEDCKPLKNSWLFTLARLIRRLSEFCCLCLGQCDGVQYRFQFVNKVKVILAKCSDVKFIGFMEAIILWLINGERGT
ncbi:hypothetical protein RFI_40238 [Reticulomyxa filosa]|uniref:Uncharacterized protein n=1 Tax=Reticulomyxa filosa TaxID=46433 RepID=X6L7I9_RETFI|nr:hypothetical protein RFI_40238 [Reticulomyxa filosa]|eukprot:ETN97293.1 hypothetical protein RFI_40238 [Reticulomyxa filosa]